MNPPTFVERIIEGLLRVPVFLKVIGIALGLTLLLGGTMFWQVHDSWHRALLGGLEERGALLGANLATQGVEHVLARHVYQLESLLDEARARIPDVEYLLVLDPRGNVIADTLPGEPSAELLAANGLRSGRRRQVAYLETEHGLIRDIAVPVLDGQAGTIRVGMSEGMIRQEVTWLTRRLIVITTLVAFLGIIAALVLTALLTRPIREMVALTREVKEERYEGRAVVRAGDELGQLATAFNEMTEALQQKEKARQELLRQLIAASEEERRRVARELHDQTGQSLTSLIAGLSALEAEGGTGSRRGRLGELRALAAETLREVHDLSRALRPAALDDLGLMAALKRHCETFAKHLDITVDCQGVGIEEHGRLPAEIELAAYRIVQEALTNAVRHGSARAVNVLVQLRGDSVLLVIEDDGRGFEGEGWRARSPGDEHLGLLGIEERAALLGGSLRVESTPGTGASLFVEIPLAGRPRNA